VLVAALAAPVAAASAAVPTWTLDLRHAGSAAANVTAGGSGLRLADRHAKALASPTAIGAFLSPVHLLAEPTSRLTATVDAELPAGSSVTVSVRGQVGGGWGEWAPAGAELAAPAHIVQARVTLTAGPGGATPLVHGVTLRPGPAAAATQTRQTAGTYQVFATREGLVGGTTANGHVIVSHDHFVALPSQRGLAPRDTGSYTVQVCADTGRCEWAPVWDEGPWNVHDDYWNPAATREAWKDVAQGKPESQAAYSDGYNRGLDGFGRKVLNPAGIDLADGTFWDGLGLSDNAWVTVSYLWTAPAAVTGTIATELNVRAGPHAAAAQVGLADVAAQVPIVCQAAGDDVTGSVKKTDLWDQLAPGYFVSDAYVNTGSTKQVAPTC